MKDLINKLPDCQKALEVLKRDPGLHQLFRTHIEKRFTPSEPERLNQLKAMIPHLHCVASREVARKLATAYYDLNSFHFQTSRNTHIDQVDQFIEEVENGWVNEKLSQDEREIYNQLPRDYQDTFRICWALCKHASKSPKDGVPSGSFPLSYRQLASRIGCHREEARRLLAALITAGILKPEKVGKKRQKGQRGIATAYSYHPPSPNKAPPDSSKLLPPIPP